MGIMGACGNCDFGTQLLESSKFGLTSKTLLIVLNLLCTTPMKPSLKQGVECQSETSSGESSDGPFVVPFRMYCMMKRGQMMLRAFMSFNLEQVMKKRQNVIMGLMDRTCF